MDLQSQLDAIRTAENQKTPESAREVLAEAHRYLRATGAGSGALTEGATAPDFVLEDTDGRMVSSSELRRRGPLILDFFRGGWCPFCSLELRAYEELVQRIDAAGASLVAISPETPTYLRETVRENELSFPVLSDTGNAVAKSFGIVFELPEILRPIYLAFGLDLAERQGYEGKVELPIPATFLVDQRGIVRRAFHDLDVSQRGEPVEFIDGITALRGGA